MRTILPLAFALMATTATTAQAQSTPLSFDEGLAGTIEHLTALPDKTPSDQFALGAVHFLRGVEKTLQLRWQHNATLNDFNLPVLRLPVSANADAKPFYPALITDLFTGLLSDMDQSRSALSAIETGADVGLDINLSELWFDINMNGTRDAGEGVIEVGAITLMGGINPDEAQTMPAMNVRFDTADVAWLTAYTHLLSGISETVVAFDPTASIEAVMNATKEMDELRGQPFESLWFGGVTENDESNWIDLFAMIYGAINQQPDAVHTRKAHAHYLSMIAENKSFWAAIAKETDNQNEWIPNQNQTAALGFELPANSGAAWQAVLSDAEAVLQGDLLIGYWRISPVGGVNVKKLFMNPPPVDIVTWVQGAGLLPYLERGPVARMDSLRRFDDYTGGNLLLFSILFN